jgi:nucleoside-specific outer membrane channel protein Tsx
MPLHRVKSSAVRLLAALSLAALLAPAAAQAEFGTTNIQVLQGYKFNDNLLGYDTRSGTMTTVTLNHFSTWKYGDNFLFADFYRGNFKDGKGATIYGEWHPRLFLNKLGAPTGGFVKNWGIAAEINNGQAFQAVMAGLGLDLAIPGFQVAGLNVYYRYDTVFIPGVTRIDTNTWQISPFWDLPFKIGPTSWTFTGFLDLTTNHDKKLDLMTQPELLLDVGAFYGNPGKFHAGVELYIHQYEDFAFLGGGTKTVFAPQVMIQWTPFTQFVP